jgi:uncharacterized membrane protein YhhN
MTGTAFLVLTIAAAVALADWIAVSAEHRPAEYLAKPLTMVALIGVALALDPHDGTVRALFVAALVLSLAGDVFLMLPRDLFVAGLAAFLLAHVAYVVGLAVDGVDPVLLGLGALLVAAALAVLGRRILRGVRAGPDPSLAGAVGGYMVVISAMVAAAVGTGRPLAVAGAVLFYASDALIAWNRFIGPTSHARVAIMVTYHLGQFGLVLSLAGS